MHVKRPKEPNGRVCVVGYDERLMSHRSKKRASAHTGGWLARASDALMIDAAAPGRHLVGLCAQLGSGVVRPKRRVSINRRDDRDADARLEALFNREPRPSYAEMAVQLGAREGAIVTRLSRVSLLGASKHGRYQSQSRRACPVCDRSFYSEDRHYEQFGSCDAANSEDAL